MAQTGFTPVQLYRTTTASAAPSAGNLADGELAINLTDEKLYFKNASGVVKLLAANLTPVGNGGTGTTTQFTAGSVVFAGASGVYSQDNAQLFWDDTNNRLGIGTATPGAKLDARGDILATDGTNGVRLVGADGNIELYRSDSTPFIDFKTATAEDYDCRIQQASNGLAFSTGGNGSATERMRIDSTGSVGIGTSSPNAAFKLDAAGNINNYCGLRIRNSNSGTSAFSYLQIGNDASEFASYIGMGSSTWTGIGGANSLTVNNGIAGPLVFATTNAERMRIDSAGNVGIGTSSPSKKLEVGSLGVFRLQTGASTLDCTPTAGAIDGFVWNTSASCYYAWSTGGSERMRIDSSGRALVQTSSAFDGTAWLQSYNGTAGWYPLALKQNFSATATQIAFWNTNGVVGTISTNGTATAYNTSSDYRLKDIDGPIMNSGSYIDALKPVQGSWKSDGSRFIGLIAHEVQEVSETPIATGEKDGKEMQAMDYSAPEIVANLIAEIQSLRARVAQLEMSASTITFTGGK